MKDPKAEGGRPPLSPLQPSEERSEDPRQKREPLSRGEKKRHHRNPDNHTPSYERQQPLRPEQQGSKCPEQRADGEIGSNPPAMVEEEVNRPAARTPHPDAMHPRDAAAHPDAMERGGEADQEQCQVFDHFFLPEERCTAAEDQNRRTVPCRRTDNRMKTQLSYRFS